MATQRQSAGSGIARAGLTAAAAVGLTRVYAHGAWPWAVAIACLVPHALVTIAWRRRWNALVTLAIVIGSGVLFTMIAVAPDTTYAGVPTFHTFSTFWDLLGRAPHVLRAAIVPVSPTGPALLLALLALWAAAAASEWSARYLEGPLGAMGPSIALFVAITALGSGPWAGVTAVYILAASLYLLFLHQDEATARRTWFQTARPRRSLLLTGGVAAAAAITAFAVIIGPAVPGARGDALLDYRTLGDGSANGSLLEVDTPIASIHAKLTSPQVTELFTVRASERSLWRITGLDLYEKGTWTLKKEDSSSGSALRKTPDLPFARTVRQRFNILNSDAHWLPAAYRVKSFKVASGPDPLVLPQSTTLILANKNAIRGLQYDVVSQVPHPTDAALRRTGNEQPDKMDQFTALPKNFPDEIRDEALRITAAGTNTFDKMVALQDYFTENFIYKEDVALRSSIDSIEQFLFEVKAGYCEQFATAFTAMARSMGIPARVAIGFREGKIDAAGIYHVTNKDAHAWPEVFFERYGWQAFEPTPGVFNPAAGRGTGSQTTPLQTEGPTTTTTAVNGASGASGVVPTVPAPREVEGDTPTGSSGPVRHVNIGRRVLLVLGITAGLLLVGAIAMLATLATRAWRRTARRRHARNARLRVLGAWAEALDRLSWSGIEPRPSATPTEFALRHAPAHGAGAAGPPLMELARLQTTAMFAPDEPSEEDADLAWTHVDGLDVALRKITSRTERLRRRLRARSTVSG